MTKEAFISRNPSHFQINNSIKAFIISESFFWSGWNFIAPIFAIFAASHIQGGNVEIAAGAYSVHLVVRIFAELVSGRYFSKTRILYKYYVTIIGILLVGLSYIGFAFSTTVFSIFLYYGLAGFGFGIGAPTKMSIFATHLDKNKEAYEWGVYDAIVFVGMALSAALGGFIAHQYGFSFLFILSAIINLLGIIPYLLYINKNRRDFSTDDFLKV